METPKKNFIFQEMELCYVSGNVNTKKLFIAQEEAFRAQKVKRIHSLKFSYISGNGKISSTLKLLLILFAERELLKYKLQINLL